MQFLGRSRVGGAADRRGDGDVDLVADYEFRRPEAEGAAVQLGAGGQGGFLARR
jgi:hypothetical protein